MTTSILLVLGISPASAGPYIDGSDVGCSWDTGADSYHWWIDAHVYDDDGDVVRVVFQIVELDGAVLATEDMLLAHAEGAYSLWRYDFHESSGGPSCPDTHRVVVDAFDATG